jgi:hypothetical protein
VYFTGGLCSSVVAAVETTDRRGTKIYAIDVSHPFFVAGMHGSGRVRFLDSSGKVVRGGTGEPLELAVGD